MTLTTKLQGSMTRCVALIGLAATIACRPNVAAVIETEPTTTAEPTAIVEVSPSRATATCTARTPAGAPLLIPEGAEWMMHISPGAVLRSPGYALFAAKIEQDSDWIAMRDRLATCSFSLDRIEHLLVGFNDTKEFAAIMVAAGIGRPELARCLVMELQAWNGDRQTAEVVPMPGDPSVSIIEGTDGRVYLFDESMVLITSAAWQAEIDRLASCAGTPAVYGSLAASVRGLDLDAPMWFVGVPAAESLMPLTGLEIDVTQIRSVGVSVRLDQGLQLTARAQMTEPAAAGEAANGLRSTIQMLDSVMPPELADVADRMLVESAGAELRLDASVRLDELRFLATQ
jgi:hypothetical protein